MTYEKQQLLAQQPQLLLEQWSEIIKMADSRALVHALKQQFLVFLEIHVDKKMCENTCNVV